MAGNCATKWHKHMATYGNICAVWTGQTAPNCGTKCRKLPTFVPQKSGLSRTGSAHQSASWLIRGFLLHSREKCIRFAPAKLPLVPALVPHLSPIGDCTTSSDSRLSENTKVGPLSLPGRPLKATCLPCTYTGFFIFFTFFDVF
jgi:hypothetical protein